MLTFEKVLEIFADYLAADETIEVYISRYGCVRVEFDQDFHSFVLLLILLILSGTNRQKTRIPDLSGD